MIVPNWYKTSRKGHHVHWPVSSPQAVLIKVTTSVCVHFVTKVVASCFGPNFATRFGKPKKVLEKSGTERVRQKRFGKFKNGHEKVSLRLTRHKIDGCGKIFLVFSFGFLFCTDS